MAVQAFQRWWSLFCWVTRLTINGGFLALPSALTRCWLPYLSARWWLLNFLAGICGSRRSNDPGRLLDSGPGRNGKTNPDGVPQLTRNPGIQLNERVSLRQLLELLTFSQSRGLARHSCTPAKPCVPCDQGAPLRAGAAAPPIPLPIHYLSRRSDLQSPHGRLSRAYRFR